MAINQTTFLREVEAAQFEALQSKVILEANIANSILNQAKQVLENQERLLEQQQSNSQRMQRKLAAGDIDRLEMTYALLENINAEKNLASANFELNKALVQLENTLQTPLAVASATASASTKILKNTIEIYD